MSEKEPREGFFVGSTSKDIHDIREAIRHFLKPYLLKYDGTKGPFCIPAIPWGEVFDHHWIAEQLRAFDNIPWLTKVRDGKFDITEDYTDIPTYKVDKFRKHRVEDIDLLLLKRAEIAWPILQEICEEYGIEDYYLEIGVDTVDLVCFGLKHEALLYMGPFLEKTGIEMQAIMELTGGRVKFVVEAPVLQVLAAFTRANPLLVLWYAIQLARLVSYFPELVEWILHECNGRLKGEAVIDQGIFQSFFQGFFNRGPLKYRPKHAVRAHNITMRLLEIVQFVYAFVWWIKKYTKRSNTLRPRKMLPIAVQFPFAFGSRAPSLNREDYEPYRKAYLPQGMKVFAGAISAKLNLAQLTMLFLWFDEIFGQRVGSSSTCGHGSNDTETMDTEIDQMAHIAYV